VRSVIYAGTVMHARRAPRPNVFRYPVAMTLIDLDELAELDRRLPLFGWNRRALTSYHDADHVDIRHVLAESGVDPVGVARLQVLTNLRVLGYVFNPVSFWWAYRDDGGVAAVVSEVSNTFREKVPYVLLPEGGEARGGRTVWETDKRLHVSPFMSMDQRYRWWISEPEALLAVRIDVQEDGHPDFHATLTARRRPLTATSLCASLVRYPLMPAAVTARIHWQALRLWAKRTPFHPKPPLAPGGGTVEP